MIIYYSSDKLVHMYHRRNKPWKSISKAIRLRMSLTTSLVVCQSMMMLWYCSREYRLTGSICTRLSPTPRRRNTMLSLSTWTPQSRQWQRLTTGMLRHMHMDPVSSSPLPSQSLRGTKPPSKSPGVTGSVVSKRGRSPSRHDPRKGWD